MRSTTAIILMTGLTLFACSKSEEKPTTTTTSASSAAPTTATVVAPAATTAATPAAATAVEASADMKAFMAMLDGKDDSAGKALKKYGSTKAIQGDDLGMYTLKDPKVTKSDKIGDQQGYTMESSAGMMKHTTLTCWDAKGKIAKITDKSE
jgi:hypothetical protein